MNRKSFTLVELLVVIAVIGLLASIIIVNLTGTRSKANISRGLQFSQSIHHALGSEAVGVWSFDEGSGTTANDASGYGNNGTLTNGPVWRCASTDPNYTPSGTGCSLYFDGVNDYINNGNSTILAPVDALTVSFWMKKEIQDNTRGIIQSARGNGWNDGWRVDAQGSTIYFYININAADTRRYRNSSFTPGVWTHFVFTFNGTAITPYKNGTSGQELNAPGFVYYNSTHSMLLGLSTGNSYYGGFLDDVRIYEKALETAQVEALYYAGLDNLLAKGLIDEEEYQERLVKR